jgi:hypothetical protein
MRIVFHGVGAFVGRIDGEQRCRVWTRHPQEFNFDPVLLVPVDQARTPRQAAGGAIDWDQVEVDDHASYDTGGLTTIGPIWPGSPAVGALYLADQYLARLRPELRPLQPPHDLADDARAYELQVVLYTDPPARRYYGFHGEIEAESGTTATVAVYHGGTSRIAKPAGVLSLDLDARDQVDAPTDQGGLTEIGVGARPKAGAIFLAPGQVPVLPLSTPKVPKSLQASAAPPRRRRR